MHVTPLSSPRMAKTMSLGMLEQDGDVHIVDQDDIIVMTQDVKNFSDALGRLRALFTEPWDIDMDLKVLAHEHLGDVLSTLKSILQKYPPLNTTEIFSAAATLISKIKSYNYEEHSCDDVECAFSDPIDQLALEFSSSVSEYLMGDLQQPCSDEVKTKSYDNLLSVSHDAADQEEMEEEKEEPVMKLTPEQIDVSLMKLEAGHELALKRAKAWSKYLKDIMSYIERRAHLEVEYSKNLSRLALAVRPALTEEGFLPLQSVYCTVLSQDVEYAKTCQATFTLLQTTKFMEPLNARRNEHEKVRKVVRDNWNKEFKKMQETENNLMKAKSAYVARQQDYEKARELSQKTETDGLSLSSGTSATKIDKKKKAEDEAMHKAAEAETTYKACVAEANNRHRDLQNTKKELLAAIREQIYLSDQAIRKVTTDYFQLLQTVSAPVPIQYNTLCDTSKRYDPGSQYEEYVRRLPISTSATLQYKEHKFEQYYNKSDIGNRKTSTQSNESASSEQHSGDGSPSVQRKDKYRTPLPAWQGGRGIIANSDTDSHSGSSKSLSGSMDNLMEDDHDTPSTVKQMLAVPGSEQLDVHAIVKRPGQRRGTTFGVDFQEQVEHYHSAIPPIITKCLKEIEKRGITLKGMYRVSGVKSTVENLCQRFEIDPESVNLDNENPNVISNVLKLYLRQLPEPLLTFRLYQNFVQVAKENMSGTTMEMSVENLHILIDKLPFSNRKTCGVLMHHLKRVASFSDQNQMNASNLGIVFGPTLLRPQGGNASLACLVDTPHQTRVVELLIVNAESLFGPLEDHQLFPGETRVEPMRKGLLPSPQQATLELPKEEQPKVDSRKEQSPTLRLVPKDDLLTNQLLLSSSSPNEISQQKNEDILLPGSASVDRQERKTRSTSDGEDEEPDATGLENSEDSDIASDDDLPLPDDSNYSKHDKTHGVHRDASKLPEPEFITTV
ncbi:rho GTPase-activating protein 45-like isoform X2 [Dreissena polymorpha]|uniref:Uncharacterized protein n=1 Tax=Dreissena polymorpha TaxID=45954 RepID=A0A9D4QZC6_DREPO|nr:rho GTPase-activating protein 45-like isoform X2 [Dreissena polymorpha]XP_052274310.1 rho GTPase-activating protein 45-like isoform X2 [Dreissena polymorpha]KAH3849164.1 hypothetical protein DPMN_091560 [Dreissena polymorpha]